MPVLGNSKFFTESKSLTTTADTDIYVVPNNFSSHIEHLLVSNSDTSTRNYTLKWYHADDATTHTILSGHALSGGTFDSVFTVDKPLYLHAGDKVIVAATTANTLIVTVSVEEFYDPNR
jgi:hypothetical protein